VARRWVKTQNRPFQLSFNSSLKVGFQGARVTPSICLFLSCESCTQILAVINWRSRVQGEVGDQPTSIETTG
jgi:hypothetical protein